MECSVKASAGLFIARSTRGGREAAQSTGSGLANEPLITPGGVHRMRCTGEAARPNPGPHESAQRARSGRPRRGARREAPSNALGVLFWGSAQAFFGFAIPPSVESTRSGRGAAPPSPEAPAVHRRRLMFGALAT